MGAVVFACLLQGKRPGLAKISVLITVLRVINSKTGKGWE